MLHRFLLVPSGSETGLKLVSGFTVPSNGVVDYTIDFDLRHAITCPTGQSPACILKPAEGPRPHGAIALWPVLQAPGGGGQTLTHAVLSSE
jgi:hypothetical protein